MQSVRPSLWASPGSSSIVMFVCVFRPTVTICSLPTCLFLTTRVWPIQCRQVPSLERQYLQLEPAPPDSQSRPQSRWLLLSFFTVLLTDISCLLAPRVVCMFDICTCSLCLTPALVFTQARRQGLKQPTRIKQVPLLRGRAGTSVFTRLCLVSVPHSFTPT